MITKILENSKPKKVLEDMEQDTNVIFDLVCDKHLVVFYPICYCRLDVVNKVMKTAKEMLPSAQKY